MKIEVTADGVEEVDRWVQALQSDQLPFATSLAVNRTALDFQEAQRDRMHDIFTIRRKRFAERSVKIKPFARKDNPEARVSVDSLPAGPSGTDDIFAKFETDRIKSPLRGRSIAVPTEHVPRTGAGIIRKRWRPSQLLEGASQHGQGPVIRSRGDVFRGNKRTLLIRRPGGRGTIFQRTDEGLTPLYQLVPFVRIEPELEFVETAEKTVSARWEENFTAAFDRATRTAR